MGILVCIAIRLAVDAGIVDEDVRHAPFSDQLVGCNRIPVSS